MAVAIHAADDGDQVLAVRNICYGMNSMYEYPISNKRSRLALVGYLIA